MILHALAQPRISDHRGYAAAAEQDHQNIGHSAFHRLAVAAKNKRLSHKIASRPWVRKYKDLINLAGKALTNPLIFRLINQVFAHVAARYGFMGPTAPPPLRAPPACTPSVMPPG
jgi:hypothetical protein